MAGPDLKSPDDITAFVKFPPDTDSLLSKFMTAELYANYKGQKDKVGFSFEQVILSGCQNTDSSVGVYAGSHDSYYTFEDLFDSIIEAYHGYSKQEMHVSDMDATKLNVDPWTEAEAQLIVSTRVRVGRNLDDFPLGPGISKEQRDEVEQLV